MSTKSDILIQGVRNSHKVKTIYIRDLTKEEAKEDICKFFKGFDGDVYPSEISEKLGIEYDLVWEIIKEMVEAGIIESGDDYEN
jgi:predicted transcriptional regulator